MNTLTIQQQADIAEYAAKFGWSFRLALEMYDYIGHACMLREINN